MSDIGGLGTSNAYVSPVGFAAGIEQAQYRAVYEAITLVAQAINKGLAGIGNGLAAFCDAYYQNLLDVAALQEIHTKVATAAQAAVLAEYDITVNQDFPNVDPYTTRKGRLGGGILRGLLETPGIVALPTPTGIQYLNQVKLDSAVRFWRRLNFGAGEAGASNPSRKTPAYFAGVQIGLLGFSVGPRPSFSMPAGTFVGGRPGQFHVSRFWQTRPRIDTKGIEARQFMDAGVQVIAEQLPALYTEYLNKALEDGKTALAEFLSEATGGVGFQ